MLSHSYTADSCPKSSDPRQAEARFSRSLQLESHRNNLLNHTLCSDFSSSGNGWSKLDWGVVFHRALSVCNRRESSKLQSLRDRQKTQIRERSCKE